MCRVVITGPPGSGKGTQGARLAERLAVPHISSGDILRRILAGDSEPEYFADSAFSAEMVRAARVIREGKMVSDSIASALVLNELSKPGAQRGFLLDGYPRNVAQAETLGRFLGGRGLALDAVVALEVSEAVLVERLSHRLTCTNCGASYHARWNPPAREGVCDVCGSELTTREDDRPESIRVRFGVYHEGTEPVLAYYRERGLLRVVDAEGAEDEVFGRVLGEVLRDAAARPS
ncbi:MAG TPA: nucleoside monophosphate kinase [Armatimonadaceae bacterium]|nr:nucleoside monophosphate kinase [Armatimonadaceae bacterium]